MRSIEKAFKFAEKRWKLILLLAILAYFVAVSAACLVKYWLLGYNAIDLAIYSQVFWNSAHGHLFAQTIHPQSYLGDHAEFAIMLLLPFYMIWRDPRTLLILQTAALGLAAYPLFLIARRRFEAAKLGGKSTFLALLLALTWLLYPAVQSANLFEFHLLAFAPLPLFFAFLAYDRDRPRAFLGWCLLAMLVREDVSMVIFGIGLLAWFEKRGAFWKTVPIIFAGSWFLAATSIVSKFAPAGHYKYSFYYAWLGETPLQMAAFPLLHPLRMASHLFTLGFLEMLLGLLMPLAFLPLIKPKRLLIAALPFLQIILAAPGGSSIVVETHYASLMLPALFLACADGLAAAAQKRGDYWKLAPAALVVTALWSTATFGPLPAVASDAADTASRMEAEAARQAIKLIPADGPVAASYVLMPLLSSRDRLYGLHYACLGLTQFGESDYALPDDARWLAFDSRDVLNYRAQFPATGWTEPRYFSCLPRLAELGGSPAGSAGTFVIYDRDAPPKRPQEPSSGPAFVFARGIRMLSSAAGAVGDGKGGTVISVTASWYVPAGLRPDDYAVDLVITDESGIERAAISLPLQTFIARNWPLGSGPWLMSVDLPADGLKPGRYTPTLNLREAGTVLTLDGKRSTRPESVEYRFMGQVSLNPVNVDKK